MTSQLSNFIVYSADASISGCGAHLDLNGEQACHKLWEVSDGEWGDGQNTEPQSMDYPNGLPKWTTLKWTTLKNTISDEHCIKKLRFYTTYTAQTCIFLFRMAFSRHY